MKYVLICLLAFLVIGCEDDYCTNYVTYEERFPVYTVVGGEYELQFYAEYTELLLTCDCLLLANQEAKKYNLFIEGLDVNSKEFEFHYMYPKYIVCK